MTDQKTFLKQLISLPGLSAYEAPVREAIAAAWRPWVDELSVSKIGSLHGLKRGDGPAPRPSVLLAAHMDAIGLMVTQVTAGGFLRVTQVGGVDPRILPSTPVAVHGRQVLPGVIVAPPDRLLPPTLAGKPTPINHLLVDTGLPGKEVAELVRVGDIVSFDTQPIDMGGDFIAGHSLDNRASVAAVTACLEELRRAAHAWDVVAVATVQEEETLGGAFTSTFELNPTFAIAIDVTFAKGPGASDHRAQPFGKGVVLDWGPNTHPVLFDAFKDLADQIDMPNSVEVYPRASGTDAMGMQLAAEGVPCMVLSIPLRYMHTPVEMISMKDLHRVGRLLAEFITRMEPDFVKKITWDAPSLANNSSKEAPHD